MTRQELVGRIKAHVAQCAWDPNTAFGVAEVMELADGVLAVKEDDGEYAFYFDLSKWKVRGSSPFNDLGREIRGFPEDTGFIYDVMSRSWGDITQLAKLSVVRPGSKWRKKPLKVQY